MTNKKRIRNLVKKKYKPAKILANFHENWSATVFDWRRIMYGFSLKTDFLADERKKEQAARHFSNLILSNYEIVPKPLAELERPVFGMERIKYAVRETEVYCYNDAIFPKGMMQHLKEETERQVSRIQNKALKQYLRKNLEVFGYRFDTEAEFLDFAKGRITRISFPGNMYRFEYYLDYGRRNGDKEILIGISNNKIEWAIEPNRVTVIVG